MSTEGESHLFYSDYFSYLESARQLEHETNLDVSKYDVCDNVDLSTILQEYE